MWTLLTFIPGIVIHFILAIGIVLFLATTFLQHIPFISQYFKLGQILALVLISTGLYYEGGLSYKKSMETEVANLKTKLAKAEAAAANKNTEIVEKIVKDTKIIRERGEPIIKYIESNRRRIDNSCVIPSDVIDAHNKAASLMNTDEKPTKSDSSKSGIILPPRL